MADCRGDESRAARDWMKLAGSRVLITGASAGIGAALAAELRRRGARLALAGRDEARLRQAARDGDWTLAGDLADSAYREQLASSAIDHFGGLDILINNAGVGLYAPPSEPPLDHAREMFEVNFFAAVDLAQRACAAMRRQGRGMIVNVSSIAGRITLPWFTLYSASKFALTSYTEGLRAELAGTGVRAMVVSPGYVSTAFQDHVLSGTPPEKLKRAHRFATTPELCARAIARGIEQDNNEVVTPWSGQFLIWAARWWPGLVAWQLERMNRSLDGRR
jgi:short-subunit dehydrogenase